MEDTQTASSSPETAHQTFAAMARAGMMDGYLGRRLPGMLAACDIELLGAEVETPLGGPGDPAFELLRATALDSRPRLIEAGILPDQDLTQLERFFAHPASIVSGLSIVAAWGQRHG